MQIENVLNTTLERPDQIILDAVAEARRLDRDFARAVEALSDRD